VAQKGVGPFVELEAGNTGIDFRYRNGASGMKEMIETMGSGCAIFDFDNDGRPDVFFVNGAAVPSLQKTDPTFSNRLYRNLGNFRFVDVTDKAGVQGKGYGMGVAVGDYDNDGFEDLYVTGVGSNQLLRNRGDGTFEDVTAKAGVAGGGWSMSAAFFDYDRDGLLDLIVTRYVQYTVGTGPYCGDTARGWRSYCLPDRFAPSTLLLYHNNGDGTFSDVTHQAGLDAVRVNGLGVRIVDLDEDGWPDILVASDRTRNLLLHNKQGHFEEIGVPAGVAYSNDGVARAGMGVDTADVDHGGYPDIAITNFESEGLALFKNQGSLSFRDESGSRGVLEATFNWVGFGVKFLDYDNDGMPDLLLTNGHVLDDIDRYRHSMTWAQPIVLLHNSDGKFTPVPLLGPNEKPENRVGRGLAVGDLNNDGSIDAIVTTNNGRPIVLRNEARQPGHSILLKLIGTRSNRDGFGTRIEIHDAMGVRILEAGASGSYLSSSDPRVHIGLGKETRVPEVTLFWPSGTIQRLQNLESDYLYTIRETPGFSTADNRMHLRR
jgi:enediyne biosynthesis protein E4